MTPRRLTLPAVDKPAKSMAPPRRYFPLGPCPSDIQVRGNHFFRDRGQAAMGHVYWWPNWQITAFTWDHSPHEDRELGVWKLPLPAQLVWAILMHSSAGQHLLIRNWLKSLLRVPLEAGLVSNLVKVVPVLGWRGGSQQIDPWYIQDRWKKSLLLASHH